MRSTDAPRGTPSNSATFTSDRNEERVALRAVEAYPVDCGFAFRGIDHLANAQYRCSAGHAQQFGDVYLGCGGGRRAKMDWIEIKWPQPSGLVQRFTDLPIDRYITIREGQPRWE